MTAREALPSLRYRIAIELWRAIWQDRRRTSLALALLVLAKAATVGVPLLLKQIVDRLGQPAPELALPVFILLGYAALRFLGTAFNELRDVVFAVVTQRTVADFTARTFLHLQQLGARFHAGRETGAVIRDLEKGTAGIGFLLSVAVFTIVPTLLEIGSVLLIMIGGYSIGFTLVIVTTFIGYSIHTLIFTRRRMTCQRALNELEARTSSRLVDSLLNYDAVKYFAREQSETRRLGEVLGHRMTAGIANQSALSVLHVGQSACIGIGVAAIMLLAAEHVVEGRISVGDLVLINAYMIQICLPLNTLGFMFRETHDALTNIERLFGLLDARGRHGEDDDIPGARPLQVHGGEIEFEHVDFSYAPGHQVLWDISFRVPPGSTLAVVGGSGSGKSTLSRLLFRLYQPDAGIIRIDGQDLRSVTQRSLREAIGIVPQDTILFNDTIGYNIGYGREGATRADIAAAARAAQLDAFIERLPDQYDTVVGERGIRLSGGERQRISIARAMLKKPPIIVFDEATSALDTRAEQAIQHEMARIARDHTSLIIAHRLSTIIHADSILVMEYGHIVEHGTHAELLQRNGVYAQMWALQQQQQILERIQRRLAQQPIRLEVLVAGVVDGLREAISAYQVNLYTVVVQNELRITGDPGVLQNAVWELCMHCIAHSEPGGRVELRLERVDGDAALSISGAGARGIALPEWHGIQQAVEGQGGHLTVANDAEGIAVYRIAMPLRAVIGPGAAAGASAARLPEALTVLVVDDHEQTRLALADVLSDHGAVVDTAASGMAALERLRSLPVEHWPRVLLCDITLEDEDGYAVLRAIRRLEAERRVPLAARMPAVALTGHAQAHDRMRALMAGFQQHLAKPVETAELIAAINGVLSSRTAAGGAQH